MDASPKFVRDLIALTVELAWFLESADEESLDPDDTVRQLEGITHVLSNQSGDDLALIRDVLNQMSASATLEQQEFLASFPANLALDTE
ncbi:hypothetical protein [Actinomadura rupiterrae]|uniref:hypothetical protein n=1 Tax=Actinomadura rupiterrae TaxID=559627 RepID=UPI0020A605EE|nr:hypothetical protein [Actinomadura rupiterrae]MCP2337745.1 hypothetical protein [Actinomadura rupiterrae]